MEQVFGAGLVAWKKRRLRVLQVEGGHLNRGGGGEGVADGGAEWPVFEVCIRDYDGDEGGGTYVR